VGSTPTGRSVGVTTPPCCNGSLPSWYGGSVGSIPTGGSATLRIEARCANWYSGRAQTSVGVGSTPTRATPLAGDAFGRAVVRRAACKAAAPRGQCGFDSHPGHCVITARSSNGSGRQVLNLQTGVRFPHGSLVRQR
jgi:hypothetical protein